MVILASGCFAAITANHVRYLEAASKRPGKLIVAMASAKVIAAIKGDRDVIDDALRMRMISALPFVNTCVVQYRESPTEIMRVWRPSTWVKGGDYTVEQLAETEEGRYVLSIGGRIEVTAKFDGRSTTEILGGFYDGGSV